MRDEDQRPAGPFLFVGKHCKEPLIEAALYLSLAFEAQKETLSHGRGLLADCIVAEPL